MTNRLHSSLLASLLGLTGCGSVGQMPSDGSNANERSMAIANDVALIEDGVRLAAANKRIDQLEAEVENLKTNPQTLQLDLLKQRLEAVETMVYARDDDQSATDGSTPNKDASDRPSPTQRPNTPVRAARAVSETKPVRKAAPTPPAARLATKDEADAFAKGGQ